MWNKKNKLNKIINNFKKLYSKKDKGFLRYDILAGITVALVIIPQSMAYAWLAWLPIQIGLYTAFVWVIIGWLLWSSKQMSTWPVTIVSLMTAAALSPLWIDNIESYIMFASLLAFFIWVFYLLLWFLRLGVIVEFLSHPVVVWFTNAIAIVTIISQASKIFWIHIDKGLNFFENFKETITIALEETHLITFLFWLLWIIVLSWLKKYYPRIPRVLILLVISITLSYLLWYEDFFDGKVIWNIPVWLPDFSVWFIYNIENIDNIFSIMSFAFIIWLIGFTESISVAKWVAARTKQKVSANKELFSQAFANIATSFFWWYWVAWSFSRTAVNLRAWAKTWLSSIITWIIVWITLLYLTPLLYHLPMATLAAIIIVAVASLIKIEPIIEAWKIQKTDAYVAIITFMVTIIFTPNVEKGIAVWVLISLSLYIYKSMKPKIVEVSMYKSWVLRDADFFNLKKSKEVSIYRVDWNIFFANVWHFENKILDYISTKKKLKIVIFDFEWMNNIDSSWFVVFRDLTQKLEKIWIKIYLSNLRVKVIHKLDKVWYLEKIWQNRVFEKTSDVIDFLKEKYKKNQVNVKPLLEYCPKNKKSDKIWKEVFKKIN